MTSSDVKAITDKLGTDRIKAALGVSHHAVRYARTTGKFPGRWYGPLSRLCLEEGIPCPLSAFAWAGPGEEGAALASSSHGHAPVKHKGGQA